ncbi:MAG TPA: bifunctional glutamate N-acetyltransferase/amino-acid acetyltransferase ArgJ [Candidatus Baltobacteraceae bacterium]|nr:bifunctional glutamate N-acetyltransferase/amino-acid acetyltransferase ArgJ [Candidatus Baltobacteraceae bacterium]
MKKTQFKVVKGSVVAPQGFLAAGVFCDIKRLGTGKGSHKPNKPDLALVVSEAAATVAGTFTTNQVCAAPVKLCIDRVKRGAARAVAINSGNANACTGERGLRDAAEMARIAAAALKVSPADVLVASTGRIGVAMPMENVRRGILKAAERLDSSAESAALAVQSIMTSDTRPKHIAVEFKVGATTVRIGGMCKGAGMIQPGMSQTGARPALHATMLCFLTTDAAVEAKTLQAALNRAVARSFNRITVDGDMSTNDTVLVLANGRAGNPPITSRSRGLPVFQEALDHVTLELAKKIVLDGEGVSRFVTVRVGGARTFAEADSAVRAVANSALVKTSWCGGDPNWGRILCALGYSAAQIVESKLDVGYSLPGSRRIRYSLRGGRPTSVSFKELCRITTAPAFDLHINLNLGGGAALMYAADLTESYVDFNKGDVNDPTTLGG